MQGVEGWLVDKESGDWVERWAWDGADPDLAKHVGSVVPHLGGNFVMK
jgi:hypothetical protein